MEIGTREIHLVPVNLMIPEKKPWISEKLEARGQKQIFPEQTERVQTEL